MSEPGLDKRDLTRGPVARNLLRMALPVAAGSVLHSFYSVVDLFWLGKVGKEAMAAPGVCWPLMFVVAAMAMGFGHAGTTLISQYTGAGRHHMANRTAGQMFTVLTTLATTLAVPIILLTPSLLRLFQVPADLQAGATIYLRVTLLGVPMMALAISYGASLRAVGNTLTPTLIGAGANLVNLVLDPFLILGWGGLPAMGIQGAAIATLISQGLAAVACLILLRRQHSGLRVQWRDLKPSRPILSKMLRIGLPMSIGHSSNALGLTIFQVMVNSLGTTVIGACSMGFRMVHFFMVPSQALAMAAAPMIGQALGAGNPGRAKRVVALAVLMVAVVMLVPTALLMLTGTWVAGAFVDDAAIIAESGRFFLIVPASTYFFAILMVMGSAFYGSGHPGPAVGVSLVRLWLLRIPLAWLLAFVLMWGSNGIYVAMVVANVCCAVLMFVLFRTVHWAEAIVPTRKPETPPDAPGQAEP